MSQRVFTAFMAVIGSVALGVLVTGPGGNFVYDLERSLFSSGAEPPLAKAVFSPCERGSIVRGSSDSIRLKYLAVDDSDSIRQIMERLPNDYAREIRSAIQTGSVSPVSGTASLRFRIFGISSSGTPGLVPFLAAGDVCQRMIAVTRMDDGELRIVVPVLGAPPPGEGSILFPRALLEATPQVRLCIEPSFRLAYPTETRQNMYCSVGLYESLMKGASSRTYVIVRAAAS